MTPIKAVLFDWGDTLFSSPRVELSKPRTAARGAPVAKADVWGQVNQELPQPDQAPSLH